MRYTNRVTFSYETRGEYNTSTSSYTTDTVTYEQIPCNINPIGIERLKLEFGDIAKDVNVVRVRGVYPNQINKAVINGIEYKVLKRTYSYHDTAFYIEEIK